MEVSRNTKILRKFRFLVCFNYENKTGYLFTNSLTEKVIERNTLHSSFFTFFLPYILRKLSILESNFFDSRLLPCCRTGVTPIRSILLFRLGDKDLVLYRTFCGYKIIVLFVRMSDYRIPNGSIKKRRESLFTLSFYGRRL